ncbi:glycosyltransferase [Desulforudis sp. 1088]|uniref:glycosyltransferase n=3 Tax=Candidatus Desulforudis TaxID=471826 RepID=UPI003CE58BD2
METGTISLCMIVKDEEKNLGRCLESVRRWVDEIVVVDTGSTDRTPDIATSYGARVFSFPWPDDFARARNESLKHATKDWVFVLDADEEVPLETAQNLKRLASAPDGVEGWTFTIASPATAAESSPGTRHLNLRMFRNREAYRFQGVVHEQVRFGDLGGRAEALIRHSGLTIIHYGYMRDRKERRAKTLRNIALLKKALAESPDDPFYNYNLGVSYYAAGNLEDSRRHYETAIRHADPGAVFAPVLFRNYALCLSDMGEQAKALEIADRALAFFPDYPDLYFLKGQIFWDLGMLPEAKACFLKCTHFTQVPPEYITTEGVTGRLAFANLAEVCARRGDIDAAVEFILKAAKEDRSYRVFARLCALLKEQKQTGAETAAFLKKAGLDSRAVVRLLFDVGEFASCLAELEAQPVPDPGTLLLQGKCLIRLGRYAEAAEMLNRIPPGSPAAAKALPEQCLARWLDDPRKSAARVIAACGLPDAPVTAACRAVDALVTGERGGAPAKLGERDEAHRAALDIALEAFMLGDKDLALAVGRAVSGGEGPGEAYFALGKHALAGGRHREAQKLLERALYRCRARAEAYYLLGAACAGLNWHEKAFKYFAAAAREVAEKNELYLTGALEQLTDECLSLVLKGIGLEESNAELRRSLFKLAAFKKRLHRCKEAFANVD